MELDPNIPLAAKSQTIGEMMGQANTLNQQDQQLQKGQQDLDSGKLDILMKKNQAVAQILSNTNDQASWEAGLKQAQDLGIPVDHLPRNYDPSLRDNLLLRSLDVGKRLSLQMQQADLSEKTRHDQATEQTAKYRATAGLPFVDQETGDVVSNPSPGPSNFGFPNPATTMTPQVYHAMSNEDSKRRQAYIANRPIAENVLASLDQMEPNLKNFQTGAGSDVKLGAEKLANNFIPFGPFKQGSVAGANIEKGSNDLAMELSKFQPVPGSRGNKLALQTILASKPGITQPEGTNNNIIQELRSKVNDYLLSEELAQKYRTASPTKITDPNTDALDDALKTIYPLKTINPKSGAVTFNKDNISRIRDSMDDAIANPQKYLQMAKSGATSSVDNGTAVQSPDVSQGNNDPSQLLAQAQDAIKRGADPAKVMQRLQQLHGAQ